MRQISEEGRAWQSLVRRLREQPGVDPSAPPSPAAWSPWQYAGHVRDVLDVFTARVERARREDSPALGWWDHEVAAVEERYNAQEAGQVAEALTDNAMELARVLTSVPADGWSRTATRRETESFTVAGLARFALHESSHHRKDATGELRDD